MLPNIISDRMFRLLWPQSKPNNVFIIKLYMK